MNGISGREKGTSPWGLMGRGWRSMSTEMFPANATSLMRSIHLSGDGDERGGVSESEGVSERGDGGVSQRGGVSERVDVLVL